MSPPLTYLPAYLGLFAALLLAVACNAFLDIQYGSFATEVVLWAAALAWTVGVGWKQQGVTSDGGKQQQKIVLILGFVATLLVFIPTWGFPRAGLYLLLVLQAAQNCVTTSRRQLHMGLLVSAVMVMFAATHHRADWTMLFYLVPYVVAVVFTLVAEQVSRRAADLQPVRLGAGSGAGQGLAIAAATATILLLGLALYIVTPQVTWLSLEWRYGQKTPIGTLGKPLEHGGGGQADGNDGQSGNQGSGSGNGGGGQGAGRDGWPSPAEMRAAAHRPGMPEWQSATILQMASLDEAIQQALQPMLDALEDARNKIKEWLKEHRSAAWLSLFGLLLLVLLLVLYFLLREVKAATWLRTRYDFLRLGLLARHADGRPGMAQYYRAMERLFALKDTPRTATANTREYLREITHYRDHLRDEATELTRLFEQARYGQTAPDAAQLVRTRQLYRQIFQKLG
ncbi:MAG: DUF4129 domain-containing protein [Dechloromonas sp.]|nr:DUF4129 domain-containing protein [Dechloromonas sp.]